MNKFIIAGKEYNSRLLVGTGKYASFEQTRDAIRASGAEIITVAVRRVDLAAQNSITNYLPKSEFTYLPNSAGCYNADEAVRTLRLAKAAGGGNLVKLEVIGDKKTLYPDMEETLKAAKILVEEGFDIMVYCSDDPVYAKKLENLGCKAIMPLAAPIGSGLGIQNPLNIKIIVQNATVPVLVDAGVGTASDAAIAMELGCDGVLMNTAISDADNPVLMAEAMKKAVEAGRLAYLAGRMAKKEYATASSSDVGII
jgi:thiazole synthase